MKPSLSNLSPLSFFCTAILFLLLSSVGHAVNYLDVRKKLPIYSKPSPRAPLITTLQKGDRVPISAKMVRGWRRVLVFKGGKKRVGYVHMKFLRGQNIESASSRSGAARTYHSKRGGGLSGIFAYTKQSGHEIDSFELKDLSGSSVYFSGFYDAPLGKQDAYRVYLSLRTVQVKGDARFSSLSDSTPFSPVSLRQNFFGVGGTYKYYFKENTWAGIGAEIAKATQVDLTLNNVAIATDVSPMYVSLTGSYGKDYHITGPVFLLPEARLGAVINKSPLIFNIEIMASLAAQF